MRNTKMRTGAETLIFWGAGATASLGLRITHGQTEAIYHLVKHDRASKLLDESSKWCDPLTDLLLILGEETQDIYRVSTAAREAMSRHWSDQTPSDLDARIHKLRSLFDWPALQAVVRACPGFETPGQLKLQDIFNLIDLHAHSIHGFPVPEVPERFLPSMRLVAARRALQLIINTLFFIDWHTALASERLRAELSKHLGFARLLTEHHQQRGLQLAGTREHFDSREFYLGDIAFASLNYDPVALWAQFIANRDGNRNPPFIGVPRVPLKIFHDFGIFMAVSTIDPPTNDADKKERVWYPLNEASAQRLNDREHESRRVRINKFLFPHGCLCWRECPSCGKLSVYMGKEWAFLSPALIPPPPLRGFVERAGTTLRAETPEEDQAWNEGSVDARACVHCGELTFAEHTPVVMQTNFKTPPPSFIEEVQRDLRVATQSAKHIILMGYTLPPDDVTSPFNVHPTCCKI
jgi:hypothetical protein